MDSGPSNIRDLVQAELLARVDSLATLSQWERAELGRDLRRAGLSYGEIAELVPAAKATISRWCSEIELSDDQVAAILERTGSRRGVPRDTQKKRRLEIKAIRASAAAEVGAPANDPMWTAGVALYWAEGFKTERLVGMANSDDALLRFFIMWTRRYLDGAASFRAKINLHAENDETAAREYWSRALNLELSDFSKTFVKAEGTGHRKNHLPQGVCQVRMRSSGDAYHRTMAWVVSLASFARV